MQEQVYIGLAMILPLVGSIMIWMSGNRPNQREVVTIVTAGLTFLCVIQLLPEVLAGRQPELRVAELLPCLDLAFKVEPLGMMFGLIASFLWIITSFYAEESIKAFSLFQSRLRYHQPCRTHLPEGHRIPLPKSP